mgnify:CR=1 FL=1
MVKILLLVPEYLPGFKAGGALRSTVNMIDRLGGEFDFKILTSDRDEGDQNSYKNVVLNKWNSVGNVSVYYLPPEDRSFSNVTNIIKNTQHDILYLNSCFDLPFTIYPLISRKLGMIPKKPVVIATRGEFSKSALNIKKWKKICFMYIAHILALYKNINWQASSDFEANDIKKALSKDNLKISVAPNIPKYLKPSIFQDSISSPKTLKSFKICFLGRVSPVKNLDFALNVLSRLSIEIEFDIYGPASKDEDKKYWNYCMKIIEKIPSNIKVKYKGPIENHLVNEMFKKYNLFFFPTKGENFGHVILESMSAGTPPLIANTTPWRNLDKQNAGWDIALNSPDKFVSVIEKIALLDEGKYKDLRNSVRNYAEKFANNDSILESSRQLFMNALEDVDVQK